MKKRNVKYVLVLVVMTVVILLSGCKGDVNDPEVSPFEVLVNYMVENDLDLDNILTDWIVAADAVAGNEANYYVIDIRSATDFADGHLPGAVHSTLGNVLTTAAASGGKPVLIVCLTGQGAGHAVVALRLSGFPTATVLQWRERTCTGCFDKRTANVANIGIGHPNWSEAATTAVQEFDYPELNTTVDDGAGILAERVVALLAGGFKGVNSVDVLTTPGNYFINNYWAAADVTTYGHIDGAYRISPLTIAGDEIINLDPSKIVVTYCWTGQTSSMITAYLTVLGYDAKSLKFGVNSMIYNNLTGHKWTTSGSYTYETN